MQRRAAPLLLLLFASHLAAPRASAAPGDVLRLPPVQPAAPPAADGILPAVATQPATADGSAADDVLDWGDLREEMEDLAWRVGSFKIVPYGAMWTHSVYATERTSPGSFSLFVESRDAEGGAAYALDARRSRVGLRVDGPRIPRLGDAETAALVEVDFLGQFISENRASVRLRHAYWEATDPGFRILVGQTWDVVSPLLPGTLNLGSGWFAGNIGFRRAQIRAERYSRRAAGGRWVLQGSLNQSIVTDLADEPGVRRESAGWPVVQARAALELGPATTSRGPPAIGLSGHIGETGFDFLAAGPPPLSLPPEKDARFRTWSANVDIHWPITDRLGFQGEFFMGSNLSPYLGGIGQGVCPCLRRAIRSTGGWGEVWYDWTPCLHSHAGGGVDDPRDEDSLIGRTYNQFIFVNVIMDVTDKLSTGLEVTYWKTRYQERRAGLIAADQLTPSRPGESVTIDWMLKYEF